MKHLYALMVVAVVGIQGGSAAFAEHDHDHHSNRIEYTPGERRHADTLADRLRREANTVCWEMYDNYRHERDYRMVYREMYTVLEDAIHIHELAHDDAHRGTDNQDHIAEDLHDMDKLFHHVEECIKSWSSRNHYHRHDLTYRMERLGSTLHHLMKDYDVRCIRMAPKPEGAPKPPPPPKR